ncbi:primosomal protein DnaI [Ureibacillus xyleni]|uniref:Primosomal protein DnaI n=1 Tax=Ureibacillus xyleni TaxID=614648 RepID=A0A285SBM5_9BACL|nr:primosomal protein DnaI [Ureibacillus xyleni]SOC03127.1 primosomal protein DnaI [Ureibacillus xyleni]
MSTIEPIKNALNKVINVPSFQQRYEEVKKNILSNSEVQDFLKDHQNILTDDVIERSLPALQEFTSQAHQCCGSGGTGSCTNYVNGFVPKLRLGNQIIVVDYVPCSQRVIEEEQREIEKMISSFHMPKDALTASISTMDINTPGRIKIADFVADFINEIKEQQSVPSKGLYIHGGFGVGKSFILGAIANELALMKVQTVLMYVPEFLRELKESIDDSTIKQKIEYIKKAPVLMLDDFGAESMTSWARDEIFSTILNYRMSEKKPIFISSNFNYDQLEYHLANSQKGDNEPIKAARMMERIKSLTIPVPLDGTNRRG